MVNDERYKDYYENIEIFLKYLNIGNSLDENVVNMMIKNIEVYRTIRDNIDISDDFVNLFYQKCYSLIRLEMQSKLDSAVLDFILKDKRDSKNISAILCSEVKVLLSDNSFCDEDRNTLFIKFNQLLIENNVLDKSLVFLVSYLQNKQKTNEKIFKVNDKLKALGENFIFTSLEIDKVFNFYNYCAKEKRKISSNISTRLTALMLSFCLFGFGTHSIFKRIDSVTSDVKYETTLHKITVVNGEIEKDYYDDSYYSHLIPLKDTVRMYEYLRFEGHSLRTIYSLYPIDKDLKSYIDVNTDGLEIIIDTEIYDGNLPDGDVIRELWQYEQNEDKVISEINYFFRYLLKGFYFILLIIGLNTYKPLNNILELNILKINKSIRKIKIYKLEKENIVLYLEELASDLEKIKAELLTNSRIYDNIKDVVLDSENDCEVVFTERLDECIVKLDEMQRKLRKSKGRN